MDARWHDNLGCWNAYVGTAASIDEARERLQQAPEAMRPQIVAHVRTYRNLVQDARERAEVKAREKAALGGEEQWGLGL